MFPCLKRSAICAGLALMLAAGCEGSAPLQVDDARIRALLPERDTTAAYFTLLNNTQREITLAGASSPQARAIEMHKTVVTGDSVRMQRVKQQTLQPGESVDFAPGGLHLMVFGVAELTDPFPITLLFADGEQVDASFKTLAN